MKRIRHSIDLAPGEVHLWKIDANQCETDEQRFYKVLSDQEKEKAKKFRFRKDYLVSVIARGALRLLSERYLAKDAKTIQFQYGENGKPAFVLKSPLNFNVSHSGHQILIGFVKHQELGVDVEFIKNDFDTLDLARNFFSKEEIYELQRFPVQEQYRAFYRCWTRKEAFIKAIGIGLSFPLDAFSVSLMHDDEAQLLNVDANGYDAKDWRMFSFRPHEDYVAALAVKGELLRCNVFDWTSF